MENNKKKKKIRVHMSQKKEEKFSLKEKSITKKYWDKRKSNGKQFSIEYIYPVARVCV